uniref:Uncharacterized protein n=1 Tax=Anguilla anguilla TaxID=7936 RepID=A0A0E9QHS6_ANGAN
MSCSTHCPDEQTSGFLANGKVGVHQWAFSLAGLTLSGLELAQNREVGAAW